MNGYRFLGNPSHPRLALVAAIVKRIALLHRSLRLTDVCVEGICRTEGKVMWLRYLGEGETLGYFKSLCFSEVNSEKAGTVDILKLRKFCARSARPGDGFSCDNPLRARMPSGGKPPRGVLLVEINRILQPLFPRGRWVTLPWVRQKVSLGPGYLRRSRKIRKDTGRIIRKYGHRFEVSNSAEALREFYHRMYVPYIRARYTRNAHLRSFEEISAAAETGFLLKVFEGERWVSAAVCSLSARELSWPALGMLPDYDENLRHGAISVMYHFLLGWAVQRGIESVDLFRSRPHGDDGVFCHKKAWGADTFLDDWPHTCIRIIFPDGWQMPACMKRQMVLSGNDFLELGELWAK